MSESKQTWINYTENTFALLDEDPSLFNAVELASAAASGSDHFIQTATATATAIIATSTRSAAQTVQHGNCNHPNERLIQNCSYATTTSHISTSSTPQTLVECPSIDYFNGVECLDIIKYTNGLPAPLLQELHRISHHKGYPSKLRYKQVKIKEEKQTQAPRATAQADTPQTLVENVLVSSLRQMGFSDLQEIMSSMRTIQEQVQNQMVGNGILADMIMMHIVYQREEKEEARKMDAARIQSENTMILQETEDSGNTRVEIVYNANEILGAEGQTSLLFDESFLLTSMEVKTIFRSLLHEDNGVVQKLLDIEKKCLRWYGTITEPFFRFILCEKIESWLDDIGQHKVLTERLEKEIKIIEHDLYVISDQSEHLRAPRMFISAQENAFSKGLISNEIVIE